MSLQKWRAFTRGDFVGLLMCRPCSSQMGTHDSKGCCIGFLEVDRKWSNCPFSKLFLKLWNSWSWLVTSVLVPCYFKGWAASVVLARRPNKISKKNLLRFLQCSNHPNCPNNKKKSLVNYCIPVRNKSFFYYISNKVFFFNCNIYLHGFLSHLYSYNCN